MQTSSVQTEFKASVESKIHVHHNSMLISIINNAREKKNMNMN